MIQKIKEAVRLQFKGVYFRFVDEAGSVSAELSDTEASIPENAQAVHIREVTTQSIQAAAGAKARLLPVESPERSGGEVGVLPLAATFVAGVLVGRTDTIAGNDLAIQFLSRLTGTQFNQAQFSLLVKPDSSKESLYKEISIKRIARIAIDKILQFTKLALKAIGSAA